MNINNEDWNEIFHIPSPEEVNEFCSAASNGDIEIVTGFLNMFGNRIIDERDRIEARAITWAAFGGYNDVVKLLLDRGAGIDLGGTDNKPALSWAIQMNRPDTVRLLLEKGASLGVRDKNGDTPLTILENGHSGDIRVIVDEHIEKLKDIEEANKRKAAKEYADAQLAKVRRLRPPPKL